jgi:hypothetical protein
MKARNFLREASELAPDRRQHAGIAAKPAEDAADEANGRVRHAPTADFRQLRGEQRIETVNGKEHAEPELERMGIGEHQKRDPDRDADQPGREIRPDPARLDGMAERPNGAELDRQATRNDKRRGVDRIERVQPYGGRDDAEGKTGSARGKRPDERAKPEDAKRRHIQQREYGRITEH